MRRLAGLRVLAYAFHDAMPTDPISPFGSRDDRSPREPSFSMSTAQLGMIILLVALGVLFAASLVAYVITRAQVDVWRVSGTRQLPAGLGASTALIVATSIAMQAAYEAIRKNLHDALERRLWVSGMFGVAFLIGQAFNWTQIAREELSIAAPPTLFAFTFFMLTGLHAAHVLGGFVPLGIVLYRARRREYSSSRREGVKLCVQYWHFLGVVWLILLATMYLAV
jgi:cytochrome c oxidase subunit 3